MHWAWLLESWAWTCMPWLEGRLWITRYPWNVLASRRTALYPSSSDFVVGLVIMCLGSGRVHSASRNVAGQCALSATGVVLLVKLNPSLSMTRKGKGPKGPLGRAPPKGPSSVPPTTSSRPHVVPPRGGPPGAGVGDPPPPTPPAAAQPSEDMVKALLLLQNVMTKEDFSKYEKLVLPPPKKEGKKKLREGGALASVSKGRELEKTGSNAS